MCEDVFKDHLHFFSCDLPIYHFIIFQIHLNLKILKSAYFIQVIIVCLFTVDSHLNYPTSLLAGLPASTLACITVYSHRAAGLFLGELTVIPRL